MAPVCLVLFLEHHQPGWLQVHLHSQLSHPQCQKERGHQLLGTSFAFTNNAVTNFISISYSIKTVVCHTSKSCIEHSNILLF